SGPIRVIHLHIQHVSRDDAEEHIAVVQPDAAEHRARRYVAELFELIQHERLERVGDRQRLEPPRPALRWRAHAFSLPIINHSSTRFARSGLSGTMASSTRLPSVEVR